MSSEPKPCKYKTCEYYGSRFSDGYCSMHYRQLKLPNNSILQFNPSMTKPIPISIAPAAPPVAPKTPQKNTTVIELLMQRQKEVVRMINTVYHAFIAHGFSEIFTQDEFEMLGKQKFADEFVRMLIEKKEKHALIATTLINASNSLEFVLLHWAFTCEEIPKWDEMKMFHVLLRHFSSTAVKKIEVTRELLATLMELKTISEQNYEKIWNGESNDEKLMHLMMVLPYRENNFYAQLLFTLITVNQTAYIAEVHDELYKELEKADNMKIPLCQIEKYCDDLYEVNHKVGQDFLTDTNRNASPKSSGDQSMHESEDDQVDDNSISENDDAYEEPMDSENHSSTFNESSAKASTTKTTTTDPYEVDSSTFRPNAVSSTFNALDSILSDSDDDLDLDTIIESSTVSQQIELREYQADLAIYALRKENCLIVAPTNSGKTHVAMHIAYNHISESENNRVLFIVNRVNLVEQQFKQFQTYFPKKVEKVSGGSSVLPLVSIVKQYPIVVLTADCVKNALTWEQIDDKFCINMVSLIIFDECHHCQKDHSYNVIMDFYFNEIKFSKTSRKAQIVGLTASPGTDKANTHETAFEHLITLCANLDSCKIAFISEEDFRARLQEIPMEKTKTEIICAPRREKPIMDTKIQQCMEDCEKALLKLQDRGLFTSNGVCIIPSTERGRQMYTNFVGNMPNLIKKVQPGQDEVVIAVECFRRLLDHLNRALIVYHLFREEDVVSYLTENLSFDHPPALPIEQQLLDRIRRRVFQLPDSQRGLNQCLEILKQVVKKQFDESPDSRVLIFVQQRHFTMCLLHAFQADERFDNIPVDCIVGLQGESSGVLKNSGSQNWQRQVLEKFRNGHKKVLFSTTVAEEGLDIVKCNMVIRYDHVTNEIAMVQSRGRARANISKYVLIYQELDSWIGRKENTNELRNEMMISALRRFLEFDEDEIKRKVEARVEERVRLRNQSKKPTTSDQLTGEEYSLHCKKCLKFACKSRDVKRVQSSQYVCLDKTIQERSCNETCPAVIQGNLEIIGQIFCVDCRKGQKWGVLSRIACMPQPVLSIKNFQLQRITAQGEPSGEYASFKKWKDSPFKVDDVNIIDLV